MMFHWLEWSGHELSHLSHGLLSRLQCGIPQCSTIHQARVFFLCSRCSRCSRLHFLFGFQLVPTRFLFLFQFVSIRQVQKHFSTVTHNQFLCFNSDMPTASSRDSFFSCFLLLLFAGFDCVLIVQHSEFLSLRLLLLETKPFYALHVVTCRFFFKRQKL
jgi:hypothetical protein